MGLHHSRPKQTSTKDGLISEPRNRMLTVGNDYSKKVFHTSMNPAHGLLPHQAPSQLCASLIYLPLCVRQKIFQELDECDLKNLSLTCYQLFITIEQTFEYAPKLYISNWINRITGTLRIVTECERDRLFSSRASPLRPTPLVFGASKLQAFQIRPPTYSESIIQSQPDDFRQRRQLRIQRERLWLCPHMGCTLEDFENLPRIWSTTTRDTLLAACVFPKCALWARHAIVSTLRSGRGRLRVKELCSVIKVYRIRYPEDKSRCIRRALTTISQDKLTLQERLHNALKYLSMPLCRHLELGSEAITGVFNPQRIPIFADFSKDHGCSRSFSPHVEEGFCESCLLEGTYTRWGFWARLTESKRSIDGARWIDIEMTLARPFHVNAVLDDDELDWSYDPHWRAHCPPGSIAANFVDEWWRWAEQVVADEGFDWRARLPTRFLQTNNSALLNFPQRAPPYTTYGSDHEAVTRE